MMRFTLKNGFYRDLRLPYNSKKLLQELSINLEMKKSTRRSRTHLEHKNQNNVTLYAII